MSYEQNHPHLKRVVRVEDDDVLALGRAQERLSLENDLAASCAPMLRYCLTFVCMHCGMADTSRTARAQHLRSVLVCSPLFDHSRLTCSFPGMGSRAR